MKSKIKRDEGPLNTSSIFKVKLYCATTELRHVFKVSINKFNNISIFYTGWNSSWDRTVTEDMVLKDNDQNRQLQKELAEKSQLQM